MAFKPSQVTESARLLALYRWPMDTQVDQVRINTEVMENMLVKSGALDVLSGKVKIAQPEHLAAHAFKKKQEEPATVTETVMPAVPVTVAINEVEP